MNIHIIFVFVIHISIGMTNRISFSFCHAYLCTNDYPYYFGFCHAHDSKKYMIALSTVDAHKSKQSKYVT